MRINGPGDRVIVHRGRRHLVTVQVLLAVGSPEAWTTQMNLLHRTRNRHREATRDGGQDSGPVLLWVASPITSSIVDRSSLSRPRLHTIGNEYPEHRFSGIDVHLLLLGMKIVGRALPTLAP